MKKLVTCFLSCLALSSFSQQQSFEYFYKTQVKDEVPEWPHNISQRNDYFQNTDSEGKTWSAYAGSGGMVKLVRDEVSFSIPASPSLSTDFSYSYSLQNIDDADRKVIRGFASKGVFANGAWNYTYRNYLLIHDKNGNTQYIYSKDIAGLDSTEQWQAGLVAGNRLLIAAKNNFYWSTATQQVIPYTTLGIAGHYFNTLFSDRKGTCYYVGRSGADYVLVSKLCLPHSLSQYYYTD